MKELKLNILVLNVLLIVISCGNQENIKNDLTDNNLKGKVKSVDEALYIPIEKFGNVEKGELDLGHYRSYDEHGNEVSYTVYNKYRRDLQDTIIYAYQKNGLPLEYSHYKKDGKLDSKIVCKYDDKWNRIELNVLNSDGKVKYKNLYSYDGNGNRIKWECFKSGSILNNTETYIYDNKNRIVKIVFYKRDGSLYSENIFQYNENGEVIEDHQYIANDKSYKSHYEYKSFDKYGNWLIKIDYLNDSLHRYVERKIEYYN
jgi:hypothetical protein